MKKRGAKIKNTAIRPLHGLDILTGRSTLIQEQKTELQIGYRMAFELLRTGHGTLEYLQEIGSSLNIALVLSEMCNDLCELEVIQVAQHAIMRAIKRASSNKFGFDGVSMRAVAEALVIHDNQLETATRDQVRNAVFECMRRLDNNDVL